MSSALNCKEAGKLLETYGDGELEAGLILRMESHLESCEVCSSLVALNQRLKSELRNLGQEKAPDKLRERILALPARERRIRRLAWIGAPLAAAAAVLLVLVVVSSTADEPTEENLDALMADVVQRHTRELSMEVTGPDPAQAASWFQGKVDFPVRAPALDLRQASFQGARLSHVRSHQAAHMSYLVDGHRVTLMIFNPSTAPIRGGTPVTVDGKKVLVGRANGFNVAVMLDGDMAYALSSDLSQKRLLNLIRHLPR